MAAKFSSFSPLSIQYSGRWKQALIACCIKPAPITELNGSVHEAIKMDRKISRSKLKSDVDPRNSTGTDTVLSMTSEGGASLTGSIFAVIENTMADGAAIVSPDANALSVPRKKIMVEPFRQGRLVEGGIVYRQTFVTRSYEVGADKTSSMETFLNQFQEAALNHVWMSGLLGDGFGATHGMISNKLIWVVTRMQVEVERYPAWGDVVELDTWVGAAGKNGMRRDWLVRDYKTGEVLARATSTWVMMHQETRKISKMPNEVKAEICPWFIDRHALKKTVTEKINKLADDTAQYICSNLKPRRSDLDMNQHVNNVKYVGWMLETIPESVHDQKELVGITLEYRRECDQSDIVQSLASLEKDDNIILEQTTSIISPLPVTFNSGTMKNMQAGQELHYTHLLQLQEDGGEIIRGRSIWRKRGSNDLTP